MLKFETPKEMYEYICGGNDIYDLDNHYYVFKYNMYGAICVYTISASEAIKLQKMAKENGEYWGAFLGAGGRVYDSEEYLKSIDCNSRKTLTAEKFCESIFMSENLCFVDCRSMPLL